MNNLKCKILTLLLALLTLGTFSSCIMTTALLIDEWAEAEGGEYIIDWAPVDLSIQLHDARGNDLLDPKNPNNLIDGTTITFRDKTYEVSREWYEQGMFHDWQYTEPVKGEERQESVAATRAYLARLYGLYLLPNGAPYQEKPGFQLYFGEIDGADSMDEELVITWPDGTKNFIYYHCSDHHGGKHATCNRWFKLDGKKQYSSEFDIVK